jgi:hypothetical protein
VAKNPLLAGFLSFFPGIGHVYCGLYQRGITLFVLVALTIRAAERHEVFGFAIAFLWIFNIIDAWRQASLLQLGATEEPGEPQTPPLTKGLGSLLLGALLFTVGLIALLEIQFGFDLDWLFDYWPLLLMAFGAWIAVTALRDLLKSKEEPLER